ncbi:Uncharacterised protein [Bordetella pertussis]|nr:Uncharacterised protein [Bordetella pertussis]CFP67086.1 Uncharacterised protein [Bordetella pertussis]
MVGSTNRVNRVPTSMPTTITRPRLKRLCAPAPLANSSGTRPTTMAAVVIRMGRSRIRAARSMAARRSSPACACISLANSTIRMPCLLIRPIRVTRPIWV